MGNPWDPLPLPLFGDEDISKLFYSLGRAIDKWEAIEFALSHLYSLFRGGRTLEGMREYGQGKIFRERADGLERMASGWFVRNCNQTVEGNFDNLIKATRGFSERRNEFAHGLVMNVSGFVFWRLQMRLARPEARRYIVMPPLHTLRKHDAFGMPVYGFSSCELDILHDRMLLLEVAIAQFAQSVWGPGWIDGQ